MTSRHGTSYSPQRHKFFMGALGLLVELGWRPGTVVMWLTGSHNKNDTMCTLLCLMSLSATSLHSRVCLYAKNHVIFYTWWHIISISPWTSFHFIGSILLFRRRVCSNEIFYGVFLSTTFVLILAEMVAYFFRATKKYHISADVFQKPAEFEIFKIE